MMTTFPPQVFDRALLRARRDRAAANAQAFAFLSEEVAERVQTRLDLIRRALPRVADLGTGGGALAARLRRRPGTVLVAATDLSWPLARAASSLSVVVDEEFLPFADGSLDAAVSHLALHWVNDLPGTLAQIRRALKPDGLFLAALLGPQTLKELRDCLMRAELTVTGGVRPRVSPFVDGRDAAGLLQRAGFALPVVDSETFTVDYPDAFALMRDLRGMAAANAQHSRPRHPTPRRVFLETARLYQETYGTANGLIPATFEIVFLIGWAPDAGQPQPLRPGSATVRLAEALSAKEYSAGEKAGPRD